jgi:hypothetical protein
MQVPEKYRYLAANLTMVSAPLYVFACIIIILMIGPVSNVAAVLLLLASVLLGWDLIPFLMRTADRLLDQHNADERAAGRIG